MNDTAVKEIEETLIEVESEEENKEEVTLVEEKEENFKPKFKVYYIFKRLVDIIGSLVGLILLSPIFLIVSILIRKDGGKAFFIQSRIGKNGKTIKVYKFRSMVMNGEQVLEELFAKDEELRKEYLTNKKLENDPRITKIGKFIRKTSIDELPQLINVLKGNMSLVGPRPYLWREKDEGMGDYYKYIISCKPGITGFWQVNGRSDTSFEERLEMDKYYSKHINAWLDIKILFKTVGAVLFGKGAK